ncbi:MAG: SRPBCC family protein [Candidatus Electryonea clarkiae]|nr:SRPBCC family protein [Candidatus Electryonea clarkiae]MDP8288027.1 SRPBCC family protein [Candidatus Electryonea clarkiae]
MKIIIRITSILVILVIVFIIVIISWGASFPEEYSVSRTTLIHQPVDSTWNVVTDHLNYPQWREDLASVEILSSEGGLTAWKEIYKQGNQEMSFETVTLDTLKLWVIRIADSNVPVSITWTMDFDSTEAGTKLTLTEQSKVKNPFFRLMIYQVFGISSNIEIYLKALGKRFDEVVVFDN